MTEINKNDGNGKKFRDKRSCVTKYDIIVRGIVNDCEKKDKV